MLFTGLHELAYRNTRDEYTKLLSETKRSYYSEQITESAGDTEKLFNIVNSLCKVGDCHDAFVSLCINRERRPLECRESQNCLYCM